jgi:hypothetical protein
MPYPHFLGLGPCLLRFDFQFQLSDGGDNGRRLKVSVCVTPSHSFLTLSTGSLMDLSFIYKTNQWRKGRPLYLYTLIYLFSLAYTKTRARVKVKVKVERERERVRSKWLFFTNPNPKVILNVGGAGIVHAVVSSPSHWCKYKYIQMSAHGRDPSRSRWRENYFSHACPLNHGLLGLAWLMMMGQGPSQTLNSKLPTHINIYTHTYNILIFCPNRLLPTISQLSMSRMNFQCKFSNPHTLLKYDCQHKRQETQNIWIIFLFTQELNLRENLITSLDPGSFANLRDLTVCESLILIQIQNMVSVFP